MRGVLTDDEVVSPGDTIEARPSNAVREHLGCHEGHVVAGFLKRSGNRDHRVKATVAGPTREQGSQQFYPSNLHTRDIWSCRAPELRMP